MKTIEILEREHGWIGSMANCLEKLVADSRSMEHLAETAAELLFLYESFADGRHQDKEEHILFPELLTSADGDDRALLDRLLREHGVERQHMSRMRRSLDGAVQGEPGSVREFAREASDYLSLHRVHMKRESEVLMPLIERHMTFEADERVAAAFEMLEGGSGDPHGLQEQIRALCARVGLPIQPAA